MKRSGTPLVSLFALGWQARETRGDGTGPQFQEFLNAGVVATPPVD